MSHLLHVTRIQSAAVKKGGLPLILEYTVPHETAPYLVSSSTSVMWITGVSDEGRLRTAVRECSLGDFYQDVISEVVSQGSQMEWGNVHPLTKEGLIAAVDHLNYYDLGPLELLVPRAHPEGSSPGVEEEKPSPKVDLMPEALRPLIEAVNLPFRPSAWVPDETIIVVPKDRTLVGQVNLVTPKKISGVAHNPSRSIAVVQGEQSGLAEPTLSKADIE